jgi:inner membrane protein
MPSPIGHALAGVAVAWAGERRGRFRTDRERPPAAEHARRLTITCAILAAAPDLDLLVPGAHRTMTHSVAAALLVTIVAAGVTRWVTGKIDWRTTLLCGAAYGSHLLLDWLGADPYAPSGIQLLWPIRRWFISPWTIFPGTERRKIFTLAAIAANMKSLAVECVVLGPVVLALWWKRRKGI